MISDIIIILLIILFAVIGYRRGIAKTVLNILSIVIACAVAYYLSGFIAQLIFTTFVRPQLFSEIESTASAFGIGEALANSFNALPDWLASLTNAALSLFGASSDSLVNNFINSIPGASITAQTITDDLVAPVVTEIFSAILVVLLFFVLMFLLKKLIKLILKLFELPLIKQVNRLLGGILGACEGIIIVWIAVNIFSSVMLFANPQLLSAEAVNGFLFGIFV